jgi:hypothetical protein
LSFQAKLGGQGGANGWETWLVSSFGTKYKISKNKSLIYN